MPTDTELIEMAKRGERIPRQKHSLHDEQMHGPCDHRDWRVILCNEEDDVLECQRCGAQRVTKCNFDDDYD